MERIVPIHQVIFTLLSLQKSIANAEGHLILYASRLSLAKTSGRSFFAQLIEIKMIHDPLRY